MMAGLVGIAIGQLEQAGSLHEGWRYMFLTGALPAPLALVVFRKLKEPEQWLRARSESRKMGSFGDLFADLQLTRNSIVGLVLAFAGVVGLWGIGFFSFDLFRPVFWGNENVCSWYRQNAFLYLRKNSAPWRQIETHGFKELVDASFMNCIHPELDRVHLDCYSMPNSGANSECLTDMLRAFDTLKPCRPDLLAKLRRSRVRKRKDHNANVE